MPFKKIKKFENLNINQLVDKLNNNGPFLLSIFILSVIAWQISQLFWAIYPNKRVINYIDTASIISKNETRFNSTSNQPNKVIQDITNQNLFGVDKEINMTSENRNILFKPDFDDIKETQLTLLLKGTVFGDDELPSLAIITNNSNEEKVYSINEMIVPGITLHSVYADQIIISNNDELEVLKLPRELAEITPTIIRDSRINRRASITQDNRTNIKPLNQFGTKLADTIRPTPYFSNGAQLGYRVYPGNNRKQFMALGLLSGDLITNVNEVPLSNAQEAMIIFQRIEDENEVTLTIIRNNESQKINITTGQFLEN
jgi:general secretion pathway protein C